MKGSSTTNEKPLGADTSKGSAKNTRSIDAGSIPQIAQSGDYFLSQFSKHRRSLVANQFCFAVRDGCQDIPSILSWVGRNAERRLRSRYITPEVAETQNDLLATLRNPEAEKFAAFILERERLPPEERRQLKSKQGKEHVRTWMAEREPTANQIVYLRALGCEATPRTMLEASDLIDRHTRERRGAA